MGLWGGIDEPPIRMLGDLLARNPEQGLRNPERNASKIIGCSEQDPKIHGKADVLDVVQITRQLAPDTLQISVRRQLNLSEAGQTGTNHKSSTIVGDHFLEHDGDFGAFRPRANETHLTAEDVPDLG
jgi:hypothetical protein